VNKRIEQKIGRITAQGEGGLPTQKKKGKKSNLSIGGLRGKKKKKKKNILQQEAGGGEPSSKEIPGFAKGGGHVFVEAEERGELFSRIN